MNLLEMGRKFHAASGMKCGFDDAAFLNTMKACEDQGGLFVTGGGFIAGVISQAWCAPDWTIAVELAWWAEDGSGLTLLRRFEEWARDCGADEIRMTTLSNLPRAGKILDRRGYFLAETSWTKVGQWH